MTFYVILSCIFIHDRYNRSCHKELTKWGFTVTNDTIRNSGIDRTIPDVLTDTNTNQAATISTEPKKEGQGTMKTNERDLQQEARICARIAMRTVYAASGDKRIYDMLQTVYHDGRKLDTVNTGETISDAYDAVSVALLAILEYYPLSLDTVISTETRRNGKMRDITVMLYTLRRVHAHIRAHRGVHGAFRTHYIEDVINGSDGWTITNRVHIDDAQTMIDTLDIIDEMRLTPLQAKVLQMRLEGFAQTDIAAKLRVSPPAIHRQMEAIRRKYEAWEIAQG